MNKLLKAGYDKSTAAANALIESHKIMSKNKNNNNNNNDSNDMNNPIIYNDIITLLSLCDNDILQGNDDINTNANIIKLKKTISHKFSNHYILSQSFGGSSSASSCISNNSSSGGGSSNDNDNMNSVNGDNNNKMDKYPQLYYQMCESP
jgi:hypothetical protein